MAKKQKKWWQYLLIIPIMALIDAVVLVSAILLDGAMPSGSDLGHPVPAITIIVFFILAIVTVILVIRGIVLAIKSAIPKKEDETQATVNEETETDPKPAWRYFLPFVIQAVISIVLIIICGSNEINSFYENPEHIGFAVPIVTITLTIILFILAVITLIISIIVFSKRNKKASNKTKEE